MGDLNIGPVQPGTVKQLIVQARTGGWKDTIDRHLGKTTDGFAKAKNAARMDAKIEFLMQLFNNGDKDLEEIKKIILIAPHNLGLTPKDVENLRKKIIDSWQSDDFHTKIEGQLKKNDLEKILAENDKWFDENRGHTIALGDKEQKKVLESVDQAGKKIPDAKLKGLNDWQKNLRQSLFGAWNNDGPNMKKISSEEFSAVYMRALEDCKKEKGDAFNEEEFKKDFNKIFVQSVKEDTQFDLGLIAYQFGQSLCCSKYQGNGSESFMDFFQDQHKLICEKVAQEFNLSPGSVLYGIKNPNQDYGSMLVYVDDKGKIAVHWTPPKRAVLLDFGGETDPKVKLQLKINAFRKKELLKPKPLPLDILGVPQPKLLSEILNFDLTKLNNEKIKQKITELKDSNPYEIADNDLQEIIRGLEALVKN